MNAIVRVTLIALLLSGCSRQGPVIAAQSQAAAPTAAERGRLSPSAPVQLDYQIAQPLVAGQQNAVSITLSTRLARGSLLVEIPRRHGVTLLGGSQWRFDLAAASQPIHFDLPVLPGDDGERFLVLLVTIDTEMGPMSRSFRIDLSSPADTTAQ